MKATLKYLQYRDKKNNHLAQSHDYERWQDRGMGVSYGEIFKNCDTLQSKHVLAWTWVISPAPDLMELVPHDQRRELLYDLTERIVDTIPSAASTCRNTAICCTAQKPSPKMVSRHRNTCTRTSFCPALRHRPPAGLQQRDEGT